MPLVLPKIVNFSAGDHHWACNSAVLTNSGRLLMVGR